MANANLKVSVVRGGANYWLLRRKVYSPSYRSWIELAEVNYPSKIMASRAGKEWLREKKEQNPRRNGRSYVVRGETPKRYWEPSQGDVVYIEGTKTKLGKPYADPDTGKLMFPLRPSVRGTTDMSAGNIKAIARVEATKANPGQIHHSIGYPTKAQAEHAKRTLQAQGGGPYRLSHKGGWWYVLGPKAGNPTGTLHYFLLNLYRSPSERGKVSPETRTRLLPSVSAAKQWAEGEVTRHGGVGYLYKDNKAVGTIYYKPPYIPGARNPHQRKTRDVWVVQGNYGYGDGWEDVTAEETHKEARQRLKEYRENEPQYPHRLKLTREKIETSVSNPAALPTKWTSATVSRKGRQIQIRIGRGR